MIKRRFYKHEHDDGNDPSDSSSSSSDSELEVEDIEESDDDTVAEVKEDAESEASEEDAVAELNEDAESEESDDNDDAVAGVKGYESEDSSAHEVDSDSSGQLINEDDDDDETGNDSKNVLQPPNIKAEMDSLPDDLPPYILLRKKVYRCRICPRVICLSEDFLRSHLKSKKHIRSEKLLNEGRLKSILNDDLEIENQETPAELHARIVAIAETNSKRRNKGRQRQRKRSNKKKTEDDSNLDKAKISTKSPDKKRRKNENLPEQQKTKDDSNLEKAKISKKKVQPRKDARMRSEEYEVTVVSSFREKIDAMNEIELTICKIHNFCLPSGDSFLAGYKIITLNICFY